MKVSEIFEDPIHKCGFKISCGFPIESCVKSVQKIELVCLKKLINFMKYYESS